MYINGLQSYQQDFLYYPIPLPILSETATCFILYRYQFYLKQLPVLSYTATNFI